MKNKYIFGEMRACLKRYWGYEEFRPWQEETILAILDERETLTILPTGGGKSLCFQLPALLKDGMAVIISPLISLMKDQVDGLKDMGIFAEYLNSSQSPVQQRSVIERIRNAEVKLLYISPERLQTEETVKLLKSAALSFFVIDEAHCISHWGHDFRDEYRHLGNIKDNFSGINIHAFTATATKEVQSDILAQLRFDSPQLNIASVDRPNLAYRVMPRTNVISQITGVLEKHSEEAGIIYCLRRSDVDTISSRLNKLGFKNLPYHAGLSDEERHLNQDQFIREDVNIIVATVAFGMGIDRSDIRFVIHAAMPKSIEHYHQETGRAGRDGLPSYCYMFYGGGDFGVWNFFSKQSANRDVMLDKLRIIYNFCTQPQCRHKAFVNYFGQEYGQSSCQACDYCLGEVDMVDDPVGIGQKILNCIDSVQYRDGQSFGAGYIANVLKGNPTSQVARWGHQDNQNFAAMSSETLASIRYLIEQLIGQGYLSRQGEYDTLFLTDFGRRLLNGEVTPILAKTLVAVRKKEISVRQKAKYAQDWEGGYGFGHRRPNHGLVADGKPNPALPAGRHDPQACVDENLFELLRQKRAELARKQNVPAYIIFGDKSLRDMACVKPTTCEAFSGVFGVGEHKLKIYAEPFIDVIKQYLVIAENPAIT